MAGNTVWSHMTSDLSSTFEVRINDDVLYKSTYTLFTLHTLSNTLISRPTLLTTPNGIRIHSAVLSQYTFRRDRQNDWLTNKWSRQQTCTKSAYALLINSDTLKTWNHVYTHFRQNNQYKALQCFMTYQTVQSYQQCDILREMPTLPQILQQTTWHLLHHHGSV